MPDRPPKTRRRKAGEAAADQPAASVTPHVEHGTTGQPEVDRTGAVQAVRRTDQSAPRPAPKKVQKVEMDLSGLEELARMDRGALDALMDAQPLGRSLSEGDRITATVTRVSRDELFFDVGIKTEAVMARSELPDATVGSSVEAWVVWSDGVETRLSTKLSGDLAANFIDEAAASGIPVQGRVASRNKGGFTVLVGDVTAFCPVSHIDRIAAGDLDDYVGQTLEFLVIETGDKTVVSRRSLQEKAIEESRAKRWATLADGDVLRGTVSGVQDFGIFVDVDGVEGLVPRSEATWDRNAELSSLFARGQAIEVRVLGVDRSAGKVTFGVKDPGASPWSRIGRDFVVGAVYPGTVARLEPYGAFVQLAPGITGLLHESAADGPLPERGASVQVRIRSVDHDRKRLELVAPTASAGRGPAVVADAGSSDAGFGTLGSLLGSWKPKG